MPVLPDIDSLSGAGRVARPSTSTLHVPGNPIPGALQRAGNTLFGVGEDLVARQKAKSDEAGEWGAVLKVQKFEQDFRDWEGEQRRKVKPGADGYAGTVEKEFIKRGNALMAALPEDLRPKYAARVGTLKDQFFEGNGGIVPFQEGERFRVMDEAVKGAEQRGLNAVDMATDVDGLLAASDKAGADVEEVIAQAPHLTPIERDQRIKAVRGARQAAELKRRAELDPAGARVALGGAAPAPASADPVGDVVGKIIGVESGGNANAKNPRSTATGLGQFTEGTWLATLDAHRPDLAGLSRSEKLALRTDPAISKEMTAAHTRDNAAFLQKNGLEVTEGNLYLAHFAGAGGAKKVLSAAEDAPLSSVLSADQIAANPFLESQGIDTAGELKAWAARKMGSTAPAPQIDPRYADVPYETRQEILAESDQRLSQIAAAEQAQVTAARAAERDRVQLAITTGDPTVTEPAILQNPLLDDGDRSTLIRDLRSGQENTAAVTEFLSSVEAGTFEANPYDADTQKLVDGGYEHVLKTADMSGPSAAALPQTIGERITQAAGVAPKAYLASIRAGLASQDPVKVAASLQQAQRLYDIDPRSLDRDGASAVKEAAIDFRHMTGDLAFTGEEAAARYIRNADPEKRPRLDKEEVDKAVKGIDVGALTEAFDEGLWHSEPAAGFTREMEQQMLADYRDIYRTHLEATGDPDAAAARTKAQFGKLYAKTSVTGSSVLMRMPPESYYPPVGGSHDYLKGQLVAAAKEASGEDVKPEDLFIIATPETARDVKAKRLPSYLIGMKGRDADGFDTFELLRPGMQFRFDPAEELKRSSADRAGDFADERERDLFKRGVRPKSEDRAQDLDGIGGLFERNESALDQLNRNRAEAASGSPAQPAPSPDQPADPRSPDTFTFGEGSGP